MRMLTHLQCLLQIGLTMATISSLGVFRTAKQTYKKIECSDSCCVRFSPYSIEEVKENEYGYGTANFTCVYGTLLNMTYYPLDVFMVALMGCGNESFYVSSIELGHLNITVEGINFGRTALRFDILENDTTLWTVDYQISVIRNSEIIEYIFAAVLGLQIIIYNFSFGCKIDKHHVVDILRRPVAPAVGFCCQFCFMAPLAFGIAKMLDLDDVTGMGLLTMGACPGGGGSNILAFILNADLELSITMTFISTLAALGMTPLWIWALGRYFTDGSARVSIPVINIFISLAVACLPIAAGVLLNHCKPRAGAALAKMLKIFTGIIGLTFIILGTLSYLYALRRVTGMIILACALLPLFGYILGYTLGFIIVHKHRAAVTISLETGFQNLALALLMLGISLPSPESDIAGVIPICYTFANVVYSVLMGAALVSYRWILSKRAKAKHTKPGDGKSTESDVTSYSANKLKGNDMPLTERKQNTDGLKPFLPGIRKETSV